jgi:hypothetical protein
MYARYKASATLESFIRQSAGSFYTSPDAPQTWDSLRAYQPTDALPIWDGGCAQTIYSSPVINYAFRAWHDRIHIALGAPFNRAGERAVAREHLRQANRVRLPIGDLRALWADVWGQFLYSENHAGEFPTDQSAFVTAALTLGINFASQLDF